MLKLTDRQTEILNFIKRHIADTGFPPTRADIAKELGFKSPNAAQEHLKALAKKGAIEMIPDASRGIRIPAAEVEPTGIPIVGRVSAGSPIMSEENIENYCELPHTFFRPAADYLLHVQGESMKNIGILDGDLLAVHSTKHANEGDIIVARIDDQVTVKRLKLDKEKHLIFLLAENEDYAPIKVDLREQSFFIEGISVGVIRRSH